MSRPERKPAFVPMAADYPRFEIRWSNGAWGIFDTHLYRIVERVKPNTFKRAEEVYCGA
jgi:hypothetical protein